MSKKVFSTEACVADLRELGELEEVIDFGSAWMKDCEGLTAEEIFALGYSVAPEWLVEVDE